MKKENVLMVSVVLAVVAFFGCDPGDGDGTIDLGQSTIAVSRESLVADGNSTVMVTVTLRDAGGAVVGGGGAEVSIFTDLGGLLWTVFDNGDGIYTQELMATPVEGRATITARVNGSMLLAAASVDFAPNPDYQPVAFSRDDLQELVLVGVHPFNWMADNRESWTGIFDAYHLQFLDRNTSFNDLYYRRGESYNAANLVFTTRRDMASGSYFSFHPIEVEDDFAFSYAYAYQLPPAELWLDLDNRTITDPFTQGAVLDSTGSVRWLEDGRLLMSLFNPNWLQYHKDSITFAAVEGGLNGVNFDFLGASIIEDGADYSDWAVAAFRDYLGRQHTAAELAALGISDAETFDLKEYVQSHPPPDNLEDVLLKDYFMLSFKQHFDFVDELQQHVRTLDEQLGSFVPLYGNLVIGFTRLDEVLWTFEALALGQVVDIVQIENIPAVHTTPRADGTGNERAFTLYKIAAAMADYEKPVWSLHAPFDTDTDRADVSRSFDAVNRLYMAEAYAAGAVPEIDLGGWPGSFQEGLFVEDGLAQPGPARYADFVHANADLFTGLESAARIGIVVSLPTLMWNMWGFWERPIWQYKDPLLGYMRALEHLNIPYDVILFGHPDIWDDAVARDRLERYEHVILSIVANLSQPQRTALETFAQQGGHLIAVGDLEMIGSRDENNTVLTSPWLQTFVQSSPSARIDVIDETAATIFFADQSDTTEMAQPLAGSQRLITIAEDAGLGVNVLKQSSRLIIHLVNYDFDYASDSFTAKQDLAVAVDVSGITGAAYYNVEDGTQTSLAVTESGGQTTFTVPQLVVWGIVVLETQ